MYKKRHSWKYRTFNTRMFSYNHIMDKMTCQYNCWWWHRSLCKNSSTGSHTNQHCHPIWLNNRGISTALTKADICFKRMHYGNLNTMNVSSTFDILGLNPAKSVTDTRQCLHSFYENSCKLVPKNVMQVTWTYCSWYINKSIRS